MEVDKTRTVSTQTAMLSTRSCDCETHRACNVGFAMCPIDFISRKDDFRANHSILCMQSEHLVLWGSPKSPKEKATMQYMVRVVISSPHYRRYRSQPFTGTDNPTPTYLKRIFSADLRLLLTVIP